MPRAIKAIELNEGDVITMNNEKLYVHHVSEDRQGEVRVRYTYDPNPAAYASATSWFEPWETLWIVG